MKNSILTSILVFFSFICSYSQCKTYGLYLNYGIGTNIKEGSSLTMEIGYPRITSRFFLTGLVNLFETRGGEFYNSYGLQLNNKVHVGKNDFIQYINALNSHETKYKRNMLGGTIGVKWLQRLYKESDYFLMGNLGYRQLTFNSFKGRYRTGAMVSELGIVIVL